MAIWCIALNTFREAIRDRVLYLIVAFAVALIFASVVVSSLTVGSEEKIIQDFGLAMIALFGTAAALFIGIGLVYKEIEKKTLYTLLARPIRRSQFLLGKYVGLCLTLAVNLGIMSAAFFGLLLIKGIGIGDLWIAVLLTYFELLLITAIAVFFSSFSTPILSALFAAAVYVMGHLSWSLKLLEAMLTDPVGRGASRLAYLVLPNLERFNVRADLVHGVAVPASQVTLAMLYGVGYTALVMIAALAIFERRDFI